MSKPNAYEYFHVVLCQSFALTEIHPSFVSLVASFYTLALCSQDTFFSSLTACICVCENNSSFIALGEPHIGDDNDSNDGGDNEETGTAQ